MTSNEGENELDQYAIYVGSNFDFLLNEDDDIYDELFGKEVEEIVRARRGLSGEKHP